MTDTPKKDALKLSSPTTLSLTKTLEAGKVKQNFQRGRSKTVTVEVKKTRTFAKGAAGAPMVEVDRGVSEATKQRNLNQAEREARLRALQQAERAGEERKEKEQFANFTAEVDDRTGGEEDLSPEEALAKVQNAPQ